MVETPTRSRARGGVRAPYRLDAGDFRAILRIVHEVNTAETLADLRRMVPDLLLGLVPGDLAGFHEIETATGRAHLTWGSRGASPKKVGRFGEFMLEHPSLRHIRHTGDGSAIAISDLLDRETYRSTRTYREFVELSGEDQIVISLATPQPLLIGIPITRDSWGFLPREHALLDELRPHLAQAHAALAVREWLRAAVDTRDAALDSAGVGLIQLAKGRVVAASSSAGPWLERGQLSDEVRDWYAGQSADALRVTAPGCAATISRVDRDTLLVTGQAIRRDLCRLGLTAAESGVLQGVIDGASTAEIAASLFVATSTVRKHLQSVYRKLGVHTRTAAVAIALSAHRADSG